MDTKTARLWTEHWQGEVDAAYLYRALAEIETAPERRRIFLGLANIEDRHAGRWVEIANEKGLELPLPSPSLRARMQARLARTVGVKTILPMLVREETREVKSYMNLHRGAGQEGPVSSAALDLARESAEHTEALRGLASGGAPAEGPEPWHNTESGDLLRNVVYGFNDGLTANFGLVAGMVGGAAGGTLGHSVILLAGLAGMAADALSMGSSGYLASKSQQEVFDHEIDMERQEIELMPDLEREELALIYEAKGMPKEQARGLAEKIMADPEQALAEQVREELKIGDTGGSPLRDGTVTGLATAFGAFIPVAPFLFLQDRPAMILSFTIAMAMHFAVGAARSFFTGRGIFRSGVDMFLVGFGVAVVSYFFGDVLVGWLVGK
ncbi:VIT1/CCC1 transporter family protein [bacterium]|nr:VIT1/CCC1 transporter family protein [bacterium]